MLPDLHHVKITTSMHFLFKKKRFYLNVLISIFVNYFFLNILFLFFLSLTSMDFKKFIRLQQAFEMNQFGVQRGVIVPGSKIKISTEHFTQEIYYV